MRKFGARFVLAVGVFMGAGLPSLASSLETLIEAAILGQASERLPETARIELQLPAETPEHAERLIAIEYDMRRSLFAAVVETPEGTQHRLRGRAFAVVDVPVPTRAIAPGSVLTDADFAMRTLPATSLGRFTVVSPEAMQGYEVRRLLPEGRPVQTQSLQAPRVVRRGEKLELVYLRGALEVSAPARALEDGSVGAPVRVQNLTSNRTVTGIATEDGRVQVTP